MDMRCGPICRRLSYSSCRGNSRRDVAARHSVDVADGFAALPSFLADPAIARGELRRVVPAFMDEPRHVYAVYPTTRHLQPKAKAFVKFLARRLPSVMNDYS